MTFQQIPLDTHNLHIGDRLKSYDDRLGDAEIIGLGVEHGRVMYTVRTFVWQNVMKMTFKELHEFYHEAVRGQRESSEWQELQGEISSGNSTGHQRPAATGDGQARSPDDDSHHREAAR